MFELCQVFSGSYSHVGPYATLEEAVKDAIARLRGCPSMSYCKVYERRGWKLVKTVSRDTLPIAPPGTEYTI